MAYLMGDDIGAGEFARGVQLALHIFIEGQVDINTLVAGAIKRPNRGIRAPACGRNLVGEKNQERLLVCFSHFLEQVAPDDLSVMKDNFREVGQPLFLGVEGALALIDLLLVWPL